ncbi:unnamed protein product [Rotaria sp. Silwood1]|nr:unnamed protein product [Rotaria sp. Silwood1]
MAATNDSGICGFLWLTCSQLVSCGPFNNFCFQPDHICIRHSRCFNHPICYPSSMADQRICPPKTTPPRPGDGICARAAWAQNATTVAGGNGHGPALNQLYYPQGSFVDENQTIYVVDNYNHRVVKWERGASSGQVVAGENGIGDHDDQLNSPYDVFVDQNGAMYISDYANRRVQRWSRGAQSGETILGNISAHGIAQDDQGSLYVSDTERNEVKKWRVGEMTVGQVIASGLNAPHMLFVDRNRFVYVVDRYNHRVIKVDDGTTEISIVAGGSQGNSENQLSSPDGVVVDTLGTVYVADTENHRVMRWPRGAKSGSVIVGGHGQGSQSDQFDYPGDLSFDLDGNLYVVDISNHRVQKFTIDKSLC